MMDERPDVPEVICEWQPWLRLLDWRIKGRYVKPDEMWNKGSVAECSVSVKLKTATIQVVDPDMRADDGPRGMWPADVEAGIVHELIHCHFEPFMEQDRDDPRYVAMEQAIEQLATAFVEMKRSLSQA